MHQTSPRGSFVNYKGKGKSQREVVCRMAASFPCFCQFLRRGWLLLLLILLLVFWRNISWVNNKQPRKSRNGRYHQQRRRGIRFVCRRAKALVLLLLLRRVVIIRQSPHTIHPVCPFPLFVWWPVYIWQWLWMTWVEWAWNGEQTDIYWVSSGPGSSPKVKRMPTTMRYDGDVHNNEFGWPSTHYMDICCQRQIIILFTATNDRILRRNRNNNCRLSFGAIQLWSAVCSGCSRRPPSSDWCRRPSI